MKKVVFTVFSLLLLASIMAFRGAKQDDIIFIAPQNQDGTDKTLDQVLKSFEGKVIYIDFWASWCAPCRLEFPYSKKMQDKFKAENKEVVFLYVSLDNNATAWKGGIQSLNIVGHHFYPAPSQMKSISKKYKVKGIPRYMLVGKNGKFITKEAPRPSDEATFSVIEEALNEK